LPPFFSITHPFCSPPLFTPLFLPLLRPPSLVLLSFPCVPKDYYYDFTFVLPWTSAYHMALVRNQNGVCFCCFSHNLLFFNSLASLFSFFRVPWRIHRSLFHLSALGRHHLILFCLSILFSDIFFLVPTEWGSASSHCTHFRFHSFDHMVWFPKALVTFGCPPRVFSLLLPQGRPCPGPLSPQ